MTPYCQFCNIPFKGTNHPNTGTGHWEYVDIGGKQWEIWYCCHLCRDKNEPCETFFPIENET